MNDESVKIDALIALGANQGSPESAMQFAREEIERIPNVELVGCSGWHRTAPVGGPSDQPDFLNGAMLVRTTLSASQLHEHLLTIESGLGRKRIKRWGPRSIDLDLVLYGSIISHHPRLTLPHPRMTFRRFVLEPSVEVAAHLIDPLTNLTIAEYLNAINNRLRIIRVHGGTNETLLRLMERVNQSEEPTKVYVATSATHPDISSIATQSSSWIVAESIAIAWDDFADRMAEQNLNGVLIASAELWTPSDQDRFAAKLELLLLNTQKDEATETMESGIADRRLPEFVKGPYLCLFDATADEIAIEVNAAVEAM